MTLPQQHNWNYNPTITSVNDSKHKDGSLHYRNLACDIRSNDLPQGKDREFHAMLKAYFPAFDVLHEYVDTPNEHIHCEPKPEWLKQYGL